MLGIRNFFRTAADHAVAASIVPVVLTDLVLPIAANAKAHLKVVIAFTVGATGGFRFNVTTPAAPTSTNLSARVCNTVTPGILGAVIVDGSDYANALAVAGTHIIEFDFDIVNGANAGSLSVVFACNSAANGITVLKGSTVDAITL